MGYCKFWLSCVLNPKIRGIRTCVVCRTGKSPWYIWKRAKTLSKLSETMHIAIYRPNTPRNTPRMRGIWHDRGEVSTVTKIGMRHMYIREPCFKWVRQQLMGCLIRLCRARFNCRDIDSGPSMMAKWFRPWLAATVSWRSQLVELILNMALGQTAIFVLLSGLFLAVTGMWRPPSIHPPPTPNYTDSLSYLRSESDTSALWCRSWTHYQWHWSPNG